MLRGIDGRSAPARRYKDLVADLIRDLGAATLSSADQALIKQAAGLTLRAEQLQASIINGEQIDGEDLVRTANALSRVMAALGVQKRKRERAPVSPLAKYLAANYPAGQAEVEPAATADAVDDDPEFASETAPADEYDEDGE